MRLRTAQERKPVVKLGAAKEEDVESALKQPGELPG